VKLLLDENLSPRLAEALAEIYPGSSHVHQCGLGTADDATIWDYAKLNGFIIVSKESDFEERSVVLGSRPKVIWLRTSNCASAAVANLPRATSSIGSRSVNDDHETCLVLNRQQPRKWRRNNRSMRSTLNCSS
jgi:predicted nuclease of predicted toxin-antitoxin system